MTEVRARPWWLRVIGSAGLIALTTVQFVLLAWMALLLSAGGDKLGGAAVLAVVVLAISGGRRLLGLPLPGIAADVPAQWWLLAAQALACAGLIFTASELPHAVLGWIPACVAGALHFVLTAGVYRAYLPRYVEPKEARRRLLSAVVWQGLPFGVLAAFLMSAWPGQLRLILAAGVTSVIASFALGLMAFRRPLQDLWRNLPRGASRADIDREEQERLEKEARTGRTYAPMVGGAMADAGAATLVKALVAVVLFPLTTLAGAPLLLIYPFLAWREQRPDRKADVIPRGAVSTSSDGLGSAITNGGQDGARDAGHETREAAAPDLKTAGREIVQGGMIGFLVTFGAVILIATLARASGGMLAIAVILGGLLAICAGAVGAGLAALDASERTVGALRRLAIVGSARALDTVTQRFAVSQGSLHPSELERVLQSWTTDLAAQFKRGGAIGGIVGWLLQRWIARFQRSLLDGLTESAARRGKTELMLADAQAVLCENGIDFAVNRVLAYVVWGRRIIQTAAAALLLLLTGGVLIAACCQW